MLLSLNSCFVFKLYSFVCIYLFVIITKGLYGLGQVGLKGFFNPTHSGRVEKIYKKKEEERKPQPCLTHYKGPTQPTLIGLGS